MNVLHANALTTRANWLSINAVNPGIIKTELHDEHGSNDNTQPEHETRAHATLTYVLTNGTVTHDT
jgi:hypothetical protein